MAGKLIQGRSNACEWKFIITTHKYSSALGITITWKKKIDICGIYCDGNCSRFIKYLKIKIWELWKLYIVFHHSKIRSMCWLASYTERGCMSAFCLSSCIGVAVTQLVESLRYKPEGRGFHSRWCHWIFSLTYSFRPHYGPGVDSASNRNEYQEYLLGVKAASA